MKRLDILRIVIGFIFMFNTITLALAQDYRVVEIDSMEYYSAKCGFENECLFLNDVYVLDYSNYYLLYTIVNHDAKARDSYIEEIFPECENWHCFYSINFGNSTILFLDFHTPLNRFTYAALKKSDSEISISYEKINSAIMEISKDGYIAGFEENIDEYFTSFKIYKMALDKRGDLDITELFSYNSSHSYDRPWQVSHNPYPVFWKNDTLYIEGIRLRQSNDNKYFDEPCYFKAEREQP